jgi:dolichol-phosphate mannosyltransferase
VATSSPHLSLVIPTLNEAQNLPILTQRLALALTDVPHEILFCDDASKDGTANVAEALRQSYPQIRVIRRTHDHGLAAAVLDGFQHARGQVLAVMDADLQHDETILPAMLRTLDDGHDLAVASRYTPDGALAGWSLIRELQSRLAASVSRRLLRVRVSDPLSGFFLLRRSVWRSVAPSVRPRGWKLLLEILATLDEARVAEVPFTFRARQAGDSKLGRHVITAWLHQLAGLRRERLARLAAGRVLPRPVFRLQEALA